MFHNKTKTAQILHMYSILPQKQPAKALVIYTQVTRALQLGAIWKKV